MKVLNLTQHTASAEQIEAGVVDVAPEFREELAQLLTFGDLPSPVVLQHRAEAIAVFAAYQAASMGMSADTKVMIGGAPFLMAPLVDALKIAGFRPVFAFSRRESVEETQPDGSVRKVAAFRHLGFVEA